ncbi:hypothetical protein SELMODRAFT_412878 [Selaginella moellendorffii]|uniref:Uncharacterized protein n=1 Tax=Selaginella moellendorffii TaxID=88036 RepID=D8RMM0_SELML|nr:hypothetical protein SELMODRAFT_412878 [Selaginella moellendorffii]
MEKCNQNPMYDSPCNGHVSRSVTETNLSRAAFAMMVGPSSSGEPEWPAAKSVATSFKQPSHVEVFKAQRLFKAFSNKYGNITKEKWDELLDSASLRGYYDYGRYFGDFCWLPNFIVACRTWFPLDWAWEKLQERDQLLAELQTSTDAAMLCLVETRLAVLILGEELNMMRTQTPAKEATHYLKHALELNPAWWEAHPWLALAQWRSKEAHEAILSAILDAQQSATRDVGRMALETGNYMYASFAWVHGAALGSYSAAMQHGQVVFSDETAASAFQLAMRLARTGHEKATAEKFFRGAVARNPSCAGVACIPAEQDIGADEGDRLLL